MNRATGVISALALLLLVACASEIVPRASELLGAPRLTPGQARAMLADGKGVILDVRAIDAYAHSRFKIAGAIYADPTKIDSWAHIYPKDKPLILY